MTNVMQQTSSTELQQPSRPVQLGRICLAIVLLVGAVVVEGCSGPAGDGNPAVPIQEQSWSFSKNPISHLSFSSDSKTLYVGTQDGDLVLLDTGTWNERKKLSQVGRPLTILHDPKEDLFLALGYGRQGIEPSSDKAPMATLYSVTDERVIQSGVLCGPFPDHVLPILSADGKVLIALERQSIFKYQLGSEKAVLSFEPQKDKVNRSARGLACWWRAEETEVCVIDSDGIIRTYKAADGTESAPPTPFLTRGRSHSALATTDGGDRVAIAHSGDLKGDKYEEERILIYDMKARKELSTVETEGQGIRSVVFLLQNRVAAATQTGDVLIWKLPNKKPALRKHLSPTVILWLAASSDGKLLSAADSKGSVFLLDRNK